MSVEKERRKNVIQLVEGEQVSAETRNNAVIGREIAIQDGACRFNGGGYQRKFESLEDWRHRIRELFNNYLAGVGDIDDISIPVVEIRWKH